VINPGEEAEACQRLRSKGVSLYESWQAMLEAWRGRLDLCSIPVPIHLHETITIAALEAGSNVLVEKPLAASVTQVEAIQAAEQRTGKWVAVGYQDFYCKSTQSIRDDLHRGRIGPLQSVQWSGFWPRSESYYNRNDWAGRVSRGELPIYDSPLNNAMAHFLHLSLFWAGAGSHADWTESIQGELYRCFPIESFDTAVVRLQTGTGITVQMAATHCCPAMHPIHIRIRGQQGEMEWTHRHQVIWTQKGQTTEVLPIESAEQAVSEMFSTVLARLYSPEARICTSALALSQVVFVEVLHKNNGIRNIDPRHLKQASLDGSSAKVIRNIERDFEKCLRQEALPSELHLAWAGSSPNPALLSA